MIEINPELWVIHDPDSVLSRDLSNFSESQFHTDEENIWPREDLIQLKHKAKNLIIDLGFYGDEISLKGQWTVYVIDLNIEEPWYAPIEEKSFSRFLRGIEFLTEAISRYS